MHRNLAKQCNPILVVEDDKPTCKVLVKILSARFEQVLVAKDGEEGLELFLHHRPALVITDIRMPLRDGISMAREIKTRSPSTKIIVITSYGSADLLLAAIEIGVTDYILKPLVPERVNEAVDKSLQVDLLENLLAARVERQDPAVREGHAHGLRVALLVGEHLARAGPPEREAVLPGDGEGRVVRNQRGL